MECGGAQRSVHMIGDVMRGFRLVGLAVAFFLVTLVLYTTHDAGRLQAQEMTDRQILVALYNATDCLDIGRVTRIGTRPLMWALGQVPIRTIKVASRD